MRTTTRLEWIPALTALTAALGCSYAKAEDQADDGLLSNQAQIARETASDDLPAPPLVLALPPPPLVFVPRERTARTFALTGKQAASVYFELDRANLTPESRQVLADLVSRASQPGASITIEGNCDERGTREYNLALGQHRADAVKGYLIALGVPEANISTVSMGDQRPRADGHVETAWRWNRRDDIYLQPAAVSFK